MMMGEYPCCNGDLMIALPEGDLPRFAPDNCEHCGTKVWHKFSRIDPKTWTEESFFKEFIVDEENMSIRHRDEP